MEEKENVRERERTINCKSYNLMILSMLYELHYALYTYYATIECSIQVFQISPQHAVVCYCVLVSFLKSPHCKLLSRFRQSDPQQQQRAQTRARQKQTLNEWSERERGRKRGK